LVWGGEGRSGFFDDGGWSAWVSAFGEFVGGEEFSVAARAVAGAQEVEETLLGDGDGGGRCRLVVVGWLLVVGCCLEGRVLGG